jgi:putative transposase
METLRQTIIRLNDAANWLSQQVCQLKTINTTKVHHATYYTLREMFQLPSNHACTTIRKVCNAYKSLPKEKRFNKPIQFKPLSSINLNKDLFSFRRNNNIGITTIDQGRVDFTIEWGQQRCPNIPNARKTIQLKYQPKLDAFFILVQIEIPEPQPITPQDWLGIDTGINNIATDSQGNKYGGEELIQKRNHYKNKRQELQKKKTAKRKTKQDTRSIRRSLNRIRGRERNFTRTILHMISKRLVGVAKALSYGIALEYLKGAKESITVSARRRDRHIRNSWPYHMLQQFIAYKAALAGIPVIWVDPRNTSRTCPQCGYCDKRNRPSQAVFKCRQCGYSQHADFVAACNIAYRAMLQARGATRHPQMPGG